MINYYIRNLVINQKIIFESENQFFTYLEFTVIKLMVKNIASDSTTLNNSY